jgi:hypothetical protein
VIGSLLQRAGANDGSAMCFHNQVALCFFTGPGERDVTQPWLGDQAEVEALASARTWSPAAGLRLEADIIKIPNECVLCATSKRDVVRISQGACKLVEMYPDTGGAPFREPLNFGLAHSRQALRGLHDSDRRFGVLGVDPTAPRRPLLYCVEDLPPQTFWEVEQHELVNTDVRQLLSSPGFDCLVPAVTHVAGPVQAADFRCAGHGLAPTGGNYAVGERLVRDGDFAAGHPLREGDPRAASTSLIPLPVVGLTEIAGGALTRAAAPIRLDGAAN